MAERPRWTRLGQGAALAVAAAALGCASVGRPAVEERREAPARDVIFAVRGGDVLRLDVHAPPERESGEPRAAIVLLHPGGWTGGSKELMRPAAETFARAGFVAVVPQYRLAPAHRFPAQLEDVRDAVRWTRRHARALGVDPQRIGAFGYSAGAHLVALLATRPVDGARIQAAAVGGTPADLSALPPNGRTRALLGGGASAHPERYREASPVAHVSSDDPPFFLYHGRSDWMVDVAQTRALGAALARSGVPTRTHEGWLGHVTSFLFEQGGAPRALPFFDRWLRDPAALAATRERARVETAEKPLAERRAG